MTTSEYSGQLGKGAALLYANQLGILDPLCPTPEGVAEAYQENQDGLESTIPHKCILQAQANCVAKLHILGTWQLLASAMTQDVCTTQQNTITVCTTTTPYQQRLYSTYKIKAQDRQTE